MIDTHQHFWKYVPEDYPWIAPTMKTLMRDFLPEDLEPLIQASGVRAVISVQARQKVEETDWLISLARQHPFITGVVGWVPLTDPAVDSYLEKYASTGVCVGMRHVLHDEPDDYYMLRDDFNRGVSRLKDYNLRYDILIFERHLPQPIEFVDRHPDQIFILDHIAKPRIGDGILSPWRENIRELAKRPNLYCKVSGMVTEADWANWTEDQLKPYFEVVLEAFTPRRLMFGSDWPVCTLACDYQRWVQIVRGWLDELSEDERQQILEDTAREAYGMKLPD